MKPQLSEFFRSRPIVEVSYYFERINARILTYEKKL